MEEDFEIIEDINKINPKYSEKEIEEKILHRFYFLKEEENFKKFFDNDYNFEENNNIMVEIWEKIIKYLLEDILERFAIKYKDIIKYTKINNKSPKGLNNILQKLRFHKIYLSQYDLHNDNFYKYNYPDLYPGYFTSIYNYTTSFFTLKECCKEEENNKKKIDIENSPPRKDLSNDEKFKKIPENSILFNYEIFETHCNALLLVLNEILQDYDKKVIKKDDFINRIKEEYIENNNNNSFGAKLKLRYGIQYIEDALYYLYKIKKIIKFKVKSDKDIEFIKIAKDKNDVVSEEDINEAKSILDNNDNLF